MIYKSILFTVLFTWICSNHINAELDTLGRNVCYKDVMKNQTIQVKYTYPIEVTTFKFCARFPFSCRSKKTEYRVGIRPENKTTLLKVAYCCEGYFEDGDKCKPYCPNTCVRGECRAPNVCDCQLGTGGPSCNMTCPPTKFGISCEYDCDCLIKPHCNKNYVDCSCQPGEITTECRNICKCKTSACNPGFFGEKCETACPYGTFGSMCIGKCLCNEQNTSECNKVNGDCSCKPSYYGVYCEHKCNGKLVCEAPNNCKCVIDSRDVDNRHTAETLGLQGGPTKHDSKDSNHGLIFSLIGLLLVTISMSMLLLYKYKMKTKKLRNLRNIGVRYSTGGSNDQFDNPVYSYSNASTNLQYNGYGGSNYNSTNYNGGSTYTASPIQTTTLPHRPKFSNPLHSQLNTSLTVPRKPRQNGYLNELSLLPTDTFMEKNALADATNPTMMMKKEDTFGSSINNIYTTIDEVKRDTTQYKNEFEDEFDGNFNVDDLKSPMNSERPFRIPEDNDSVDLQFMQVTKKAEAIDNPFNDQDNEFLMHYDKPNPKSPAIESTLNRSTYEVPKPLNSEPAKDVTKNLTKDLTKELNESKQINTSHYDNLASNTHYETLTLKK